MRAPVAWRLTVCFVLVSFVIAPARALAQRLPIRPYTTIDGLASDRVARIVRDPRGFLWFCTANGVSRFDGERFTTYGPDMGLPHPSINDLLITRAGQYILASNGGGAIALDVRPRDTEAPRDTDIPHDAWRFQAHRVGDDAAANRLNVLLEDRQGRIWIGTDAGLFVVERWQPPVRFTPVALGGVTPDASTQVWAFVEGRDGSLWIGTNVGLFRRLPDGQIVSYTWTTFPGRVLAMIEDRASRVWVGHDQGVSVFLPDDIASVGLLETAASPASPVPHTPAIRRLTDESRRHAPRHLSDALSPVLPAAPGQVMSWTAGGARIPIAVTALTLARDGHVWLAALDRLIEFDGRQFQSSRMPVGGIGAGPSPLIEDADGHIWVGTLVDGALRFAPRGLMTFTEADGARGTFVNTFKTRDGRRCAYTAEGVVSCYDGRRFVVIGTPRPGSDSSLAGARVLLEDRTRQWWVATRRGPTPNHLAARHRSHEPDGAARPADRDDPRAADRAEVSQARGDGSRRQRYPRRRHRR